MGTSLSWLRSFNFCLSYFWEFGIFLVLLGTLDTLESFFLFQCTSCLHNWIKCHQIFSLSNCCLFCFSFLCHFLLFHIFFFFYLSPWCRISSLSLLLLIVLPQKC